MTNSTKGTTLVELMIYVTLLAILGGSVVLTVGTASNSVKVGTADSRVNSLATEAMDLVAARLAAASFDTLTPPPPGATSTVEYRRVVDFAAGTAVLSNLERIEMQASPGDPDDGVDNDGDGLIDECRLVLVEDVGLPTERTIVISNWVREAIQGEIPGNMVDDNGNGLVDEGGFLLESDASSRGIVVRLTIEQRAPRMSVPLTCTLARTVTVHASDL